MRKLFITILIIAINISIFAQDSTEHKAHWTKDFEKAQKISKRKHKPLLVLFTGSDWCSPCKQLHEDFFNSDKFIEIADKDLVLYEADFPRRTDLITPETKAVNTILKKRYGIKGFPTILILSPTGSELGRFKGYSFMRDPEPHFKLVNDAIQANK